MTENKEIKVKKNIKKTSAYVKEIEAKAKNGFLNKQHEAKMKLQLYSRAFPLNSYFKIGSGFFLR